MTLAEVVQFSVKKAGFDLVLDPVDAGGYTARTAANDYDIAAFYYVRAEPDILRTVFHSAYIPPKGANVARVDSLDGKLNEAVAASDEVRKRLYSEIQRQIVDQAYAGPLYVGRLPARCDEEPARHQLGQRTQSQISMMPALVHSLAHSVTCKACAVGLATPRRDPGRALGRGHDQLSRGQAHSR